MKITGNRISLNEDELRKIIGDTIEKGLYEYYEPEEADNLSGFDEEEDVPEVEYENDYVNDAAYDPKRVTREQLIDFCRKNDFLFVYESPLFDTRARAANNERLKNNIIEDLQYCNFEPTHEVDDLVLEKVNLYDSYVTVFKLSDMKDEKDYYIVYEEFK